MQRTQRRPATTVLTALTQLQATSTMWQQANRRLQINQSQDTAMMSPPEVWSLFGGFAPSVGHVRFDSRGSLVSRNSATGATGATSASRSSLNTYTCKSTECIHCTSLHEQHFLLNCQLLLLRGQQTLLCGQQFSLDSQLVLPNGQQIPCRIGSRPGPSSPGSHGTWWMLHC
ncbi:hypothetical protein HPB47_000974 [Ixodes persulcatus]|uniref:Uncharacterized protein n=1 Tax=Ixodes persulcatus TaxID=34615 RepID=A0AC60PRT4_IXOPE|nr:hypothetical protein HPB47_000974 [Ixodes persulcatus]